MQSPLFAFNEAQTQERWSLQNKQMLRVTLEGHDDILARKGTMVAYQGLIEFDAEYQSGGQARTRAYTGEGLDLMRCHGQGTVYLANLAQYVHIMDVEQDGLTVDSSYVLAMDSTLYHEAVAVDSMHGISGSGKYQLNITGHGRVALMTSGAPLLMQVTPDKYVNCDADAIVAWSTALRVQMQAQTHSSGVWRRRGGTGEGWELSFMGSGYALVQPSELLPPQDAVIGQGLAAQFGMGQQGARGQNQGNVWG
ncbi:AIM24 family protein [Streptomyces sp. NPDC017179]|uniref:AIM24 family protein n=1 Tax=Streptomyces sp. NPDC017179 TaxID=3364979 RepID=UPI0037A50C63